MSFFEPPPPPEPITPEQFEVPDWYGPPEGVLGGVVPLELLLARSEKAAVVIESATVYPTGIELVIDVHWRERSEEWLFPGGFEHRRRRQGGGLPDELFRAGVQFADGSKATTLESGLDMPIAVAYGEGSTAGRGAGLRWRTMRSPRNKRRRVRCSCLGAGVVVVSVIHNRSGSGRCRLKGR